MKARIFTLFSLVARTKNPASALRISGIRLERKTLYLNESGIAGVSTTLPSVSMNEADFAPPNVLA
jgi:hypothetical protein